MNRTTVALLYIVGAAPLGAQMSMEHDHHSMNGPPAPAVEQLIAQARSATEMYSDRSVAIAHGYRRVGRDLPMMGEHWLNTRLLIEAGFDATRPPILTYLDVDGKPTLTGIVFAVPLDPGQSPPDAFGSDAMWHEHNGSIDEEALVPEHHTMPSTAKGTRVAFLHVWTRAPIDESIFSAENWTLPFVRAGIPVPEKFAIGAAKCLSVASNRAYYVDMHHSHEVAPFDECAKLRFKRGVPLTPSDLELLDSAWERVESAMKGGS